MVQQVIMEFDTPISIKPLIESAIQREVKILALGITRTEERLREFESRYEMSSTEFEERFQSGDLGDDFDFIEWSGELDIYTRLRQQKQALQGMKFN